MTWMGPYSKETKKYIDRNDKKFQNKHIRMRWIIEEYWDTMTKS